ncbi:MAG: GAF domain-containing protein [Bacteroidales bacterium]|nr:GAF domain-containing protein [Bacteroidales bacterium]
MKLRAKIFLFIFITSFIIFTIVIGIIVFRYRNDSLHKARDLADSFTIQGANSVKSTLEKDLGVTKTMALFFKGFDKIDGNLRHKIYSDAIGNVLNGHPEYMAVWMSWELRFIDKNYTKPYGRQRTVAVKDAGNIKLIIDTVETEGDAIGSMYYQLKMSKKDLLTNPYFYVYSPKEGGDSILETSIAVPILKDGEFAGLSGIDITLNRFQKLTDQIRPFENSYAILIANNGTIISFPDEKFAGDSIIKVFPEFVKFNVMEKIREGKQFSFIYVDSLSYSNYVSFSPIKVGNTGAPWALCLIAPTKKIEEEAIANFNYSLFVGFIGLLGFSLIMLFISQRLTLPLKQSIDILKDLDKGIIDFSKQVKAHSKDELAEMARTLNKLMYTLNETAIFARKIGQGDLTASYKPLSDKDVLGNALIDMQRNLRKSTEIEEVRSLERKKQEWAQKGITQLGEILRKSSDNLEDYLLSIISNIVGYLKAQQGAIFILNDDNPEKVFLELRTAYAYNKKKVLEAKVEIGESLVGRCFQEREIIYLKDLPEGYTFISSGLGEHEPKSLILLPLMFEAAPFGVIEIASLHELADFEIEFLKSISERVASSISVALKNQKTEELLEKYQRQSVEIEEREQSLQAHLAELQEAQNEIEINKIENQSVIDALTKIGSVVWYDMDGKILDIKDPHLSEAGLSEKSMIGKNQREFAPEAKENPEEYEKFWKNLRSGIVQKRVFKTLTSKGLLWISEIYTPIKDHTGKPYKVINIGIDISQQKTLEEQIKKLQEEIELLKKQLKK